MRIAFFVNAFPVVSETFILNQITGLIDRGHTVDIFAFSRRSDDGVHPNIRRYDLALRTTYLNGVGTRIERMLTAGRLMSRKPWLTRKGLRAFTTLVRSYGDTVPFNVLSVIRIVSREIDGGEYDVIHCQYGTLGRALVRLKRIGLIHGRLVTSFRGHDVTQRSKLEKGYYDELFREADLLLPVSRNLEARLLAIGAPPERTTVHHSGIDCARFHFRERGVTHTMPMVILTVARLVEMKGVKYGVEAVATLLQGGHQVVYHIIGDGPLMSALRAQVAELGIEAHVRFHGARSSDEVLRMLGESDVLLAPSITATDGEAEGIPNAVKEAMASGMPVVVTEHSGVPELVDEGVSGYLVPERDAAALAARLAHLSTHPELWRELGRNGRAKIEREFDIHRLNDELTNLYSAPIR